MALIEPLPPHKFRLDLMGNELFSSSVVDFQLNVVTQQIVVTVRESVDCQIMPLVIDLASYQSTSMTWEALEKGNATVATMFFHGLKLIDHNFSQTYIIANGTSDHVLTFSYIRAEKA